MAGEFAIIFTIILFIIVMIITSIEKMDYVSYTIIAAVIACLVTVASGLTDPVSGELLIDMEPNKWYSLFISYIEFDVIFFIISMQIVVSLAEEANIFQWMILKVLRFTKGDHRKFFYFICVISSISAAIISDITIAIIFIPLVIRACKILDIKAAPYLFGISFTINIGSIYTPFSSSENILIASSYGLNFGWFILNFTPFVIIVLIATLLVLDFTMLRKIDPPTERQKLILQEIMNPEIVIKDRKKFISNVVYFISVILGFIFLSEYAIIVAVLGAVLICLFNKRSFSEMILKIDWKVITYFVGIFILIGNMQINGTFNIISDLAGNIIGLNVYASAITVLLLISVLSGFLAQIPTALVFIQLLNQIYGGLGMPVPTLVLMAFLLGINIGSNFLPQGAACDLIALNLAEKNKVEGFNYKTLLKNGSKITLFHIFNSIIYLTLFALITGIL